MAKLSKDMSEILWYLDRFYRWSEDETTRSQIRELVANDPQQQAYYRKLAENWRLAEQGITASMWAEPTKESA